MRRAPQNPTELRRLRRQLAAFRRVLPSLDLKRKQLALHLVAERGRLDEARSALERAEAGAAERLPMLADDHAALESLVRIASPPSASELIAGVAVPALPGVTFRLGPHGLMATPEWLEGYIEAIQSIVQLRVRLAAHERRVAALEAGLRQAQQRVNLLEKLLIPRTEKAARAIEVLLADAKRAEVVRAKIAKARTARATTRPGASA